MTHTPRFGRTVADVRGFIAEAEAILIAVRAGFHDHDYFTIDEKTALANLDSYQPEHLMASELKIGTSGRNILCIGSRDAIRAAETAQREAA